MVEDEFTKGGADVGVTFTVTNQGIGGPAPDLVLNGAATLGGGQMCIGRSDDASPDHPSLAINSTFTIVDPFEDLGPMPSTAPPGRA